MSSVILTKACLKNLTGLFQVPVRTKVEIVSQKLFDLCGKVDFFFKVEDGNIISVYTSCDSTACCQ